LTAAVTQRQGFIRALKIQARVIGALILREIITRYGRHNIGFMWLFVEPMIFTLGVLALWTALGLHKVALPIVAFTLSGYATVLLWRNTINRCGNAVEPNRALMHHRNVRIIDLYAARIILEIAGASISFLLLTAVFIAIGMIEPPDDLLKILLAWFLLAWFSLDMALIIGSLAALSESVDRIWHVASYLFLPLSGAFFMVDWLPPYAQELVLWVPTVNCTELLREGLFGNMTRAHYDIGYVVLVNLLLMLPGLLLVRYVATRVEGE
jgi:capsular polysaccharide transport system permease protein